MTTDTVKDAIREFNAHLKFCGSPEDCPDLVGLAAAIRDLKAERRQSKSVDNNIVYVKDEDVRILLTNLSQYNFEFTANELAQHFMDLEARLEAIHRMPVQIREFHDDGRGWLDDWRDIKLNQSIDDFIHRHPSIQIRIKP